MSQHSQEPIFLDQSGRRWRRLRRGALAAGVVTTLVLLVAVVFLVIPPFLPDLPLRQTAADSLGGAIRSARTPTRRLPSAKEERERIQSRQRLFEELERHPATPARRYSQMPITRPRVRQDSLLAARSPRDPIVAGFYVNWDDNSLFSLRQRIDHLDWIVAEWVLLAPKGDSLPLRFNIDRRVLALAAHAPHHPQVFAMVTNFTGQDFDARAVGRIIGNAVLRRRALRQLVTVLDTLNLAGVTIDFELLPPSMHPQMLRFLHELKAALAPSGRLVTEAIPGDDEQWPVAAYAAVNDRIFLMLYDENDPSDPPGPLASDGWFRHHLDRVLSQVPAQKVIATIGQYGYDWSDTAQSATEMTFQDVIQAARDHQLHPTFDSLMRNPTFGWRDSSGVSHIVWALDGPTGFNQMRIAEGRGVGGVGVWRLGSEDPSLWSILGRGRRGRRPVAAGHDPHQLRRGLPGLWRDPPDGGGAHLRPPDPRARRHLRPGDQRTGRCLPFDLRHPAHRPPQGRDRAHLRRRARPQVDSRDPRHPALAGGPRHLLRHRPECRGQRSAFPADVPGRARNREPHLHPSEPCPRQLRR